MERMDLDHPLVRERLAASNWVGALVTLSNRYRPDLIEHMLALGMAGTPELATTLTECWEHGGHNRNPGRCGRASGSAGCSRRL
jgi:hypothetical protein